MGGSASPARRRKYSGDGKPPSRTGFANPSAAFILAKKSLHRYFATLGCKIKNCFCSHELGKHINKRVAPKLDQHAAHELNTKRKLICPRLGAAVDFIVDDENMREVADWVAENTPFDRLYFYGEDRPIHASYGPEQKGETIDLVLADKGRQEPKIRKY